MSKELPYFRFTASEWLNGDISLEDYSLKGVFTDVCAYYWFKDCSITIAMLEKRFNNAKDMLNQLFDLGFIKVDEEDGEYISISFLDEQFDRLSDSRKRRQEAGRKGGKQRSSNAQAMLQQSSSYKDKDKDKNIKKDIIKKEKPIKTQTIIPPTIEMVQTYCEDRKNKVDPDKFVNYYTSKGWMIGKQKMKDWQAAVRTWEKNNFNDGGNKHENPFEATVSPSNEFDKTTF